MKEVHALADHIRDAWNDFHRRVPLTFPCIWPERRVWVSPAMYGKIRDYITDGAYIHGAKPWKGYPDFELNVLGFRVHRDETLGPEDCRIVIRTAT